ncbi:hypothetical protein [Salinarchaeum laminariae]|uniref:hypothetical protein n=1 Tax=Salinarchaeum laminariae TaxID=869888 RepID=UPI0020C07344|nr:hypothetical protein [Salinarchaeum laminariae]
MKGDGATTLEAVGSFDGGATWLAYPDEVMARASHVLFDPGDGADEGAESATDDLWLVDPVDTDDLDEWLAERGTVAGVVILLDRHKRDAARIAARHDVPVHVPEQFADVREELSAPTTLLGDELGDTGYRPVPVVNRSFWHEVALYRERDGTLIVPEAVGTAEYFCVGGERLGVHPALRLFPPRSALGNLDPERVLVGHGAPVLEDGTAALREALAASRRGAPRLYAQSLRSALPF